VVRQNRKNHYSKKRQVSSLKRVDASRYRRRNTRRFVSTTMVAMISVEASSTSKRPESLAPLMVLPRPGAETMWP